MVGNKEFQLKKTESYIAIISLSIFLFGYSYSAIKIVNCYYDESLPEVFDAQILNKRADTDKIIT